MNGNSSEGNPTTIRALIVDDEPLARELLRSMLEREPDIEIVGERGGAGDIGFTARGLVDGAPGAHQRCQKLLALAGSRVAPSDPDLLP